MLYICRNSSLSKFFDQFFAVLSSLQNERDHTTLMALAKRKVDIKDPIELEYASITVNTIRTRICVKATSSQTQGRSHSRIGN